MYTILSLSRARWSILFYRGTVMAMSWRRCVIRLSRTLGASCLFVNLLIGSGVDIADTNHIEGSINITSDRMSRGVSSHDLGFPDACIVDFMSCPICSDIITAMNPLHFASSDPLDVHHTFALSRSLVDTFLQRYSDGNVLASMCHTA